MQKKERSGAPVGNRVSTVYLLTCAAIGVSGGILLWGATALATVLYVTIPFISVALAGVWLLPAVVGLRLLHRPLAGLLVGLISGVVVLPYLVTNVWWAFFAELPFVLLLYRRWDTWLHYLGAAVVGILYPILAASSYNLWTQPVWAQLSFFALTLGSCLAGTFVGILIADRLHAAGVARLARKTDAAD